MQKYILFTLLLVLSTTTMAQKEKRINQYVFRLDSVNSEVKSEIVGKILYEDNYSRQYQIRIIDQKGKNERTLTTDSIIGYRCKEGVFTLKTFSLHGMRQKAFLKRVSIFETDSIVFFSYVDKGNNSYDLVQLGTSDEVLPLYDYDANGYENPLKKLLLSNEYAKDKQVADYINKHNISPSTYETITKRFKIGHPERLPRFRWGGVAKIGLRPVYHDSFTCNNATVPEFGLFADIPLFSVVSFHPELTMSKYNTRGTIDLYGESWVANNVTTVNIPVFLRISHQYAKGKFIPFADLGCEMRYALKNKFDYRWVTYDLEIYKYHSFSFSEVHYDSEDGKKFFVQPVAGVGFEWQVLPRHSVFFEFLLGINKKMSECFSVSFNI